MAYPSPCPGGGPTGPLPGTPAVVAVTSTAVESALILAGFPEVAAILAPFLVLQNFAVEDFCGQGPPPLPDLGPQDMLDVVNMVDPTISFPAIDKFKQWWAVHEWYLLCGCTGAATPAPPPLVLPPGPGADQGLPSGTVGAECYSKSATLPLAAAVNFPPTSTFADVMAAIFPASWLTPCVPTRSPYANQMFGSGLPTFSQFRLTATADHNPTTRDVTLALGVSSGGAWSNLPLLTWSHTGGPLQQSIVVGTTFGGSPVGPNSMFILESPDTAPFTLTLDVQVICGSPTAPETPCCPPDPLVSNYLNQILNLETLIYNKLAAASPAASYRRGTRHAGLTGTGSVNVSGLFGVLVEITSGVPTTPELPGVPPYQWSVGWVSVLTGDGMIDEIRLTRQAQVWASRLAPYATIVGYQVNAGFTIDMTELLPV